MRGAVPIESLSVGERVLTTSVTVGSDGNASETDRGTAVDPDTHRLVRLKIEDRWSDGTLDVVDIETLQSSAWISDNRVEPGARVGVPLELREMGLPELLAEVVSVEPCPPIETSGGRVLLTTVNHLSSFVFELSLEDASGKVDTLEVTGWHKFFSESRGWVSVVELEPGELLRSLNVSVITSNATTDYRIKCHQSLIPLYLIDLVPFKSTRSF